MYARRSYGAARKRHALVRTASPRGLFDETGKRHYAVVQLRRENVEGSAYNIVGFQTNLKFSEQKRVFGMIPALKNAEFLRYGVMHRNTFINAPEVVDANFRVKKYPKTYVAGQLSGVEGYVGKHYERTYRGAFALPRNKRT